ncbi:hypothetical protein BpHYR1_042394 [Brachionus plicatilis]|uniref:Uncharacterized protein n=1 Tax=Brachionus plicatilis TaxID=10195 RepID=A0A3M7RFJ6_BRAPC|nr:hypothetical protein BpHYR1_042394 [Brachionus plicatilis]
MFKLNSVNATSIKVISRPSRQKLHLYLIETLEKCFKDDEKNLKSARKYGAVKFISIRSFKKKYYIKNTNALASCSLGSKKSDQKRDLIKYHSKKNAFLTN